MIDGGSSNNARGTRWQALVEELRRRVGGGAPLEPPLRTAFEGRLGHDLSGVLMHRTPFSGRLVQAFGADALTAGAHVLGGAQELDPATQRGTALLGHELTHTLQAESSMSTSGQVQRAAESALESQAQDVERALAQQQQQQPAGPTPPAAAGGASIEPEVVAERVYQLLLDELIYDQERGAGR